MYRHPVMPQPKAYIYCQIIIMFFSKEIFSTYNVPGGIRSFIEYNNLLRNRCKPKFLLLPSYNIWNCELNNKYYLWYKKILVSKTTYGNSQYLRSDNFGRILL